MAINFYMLRSLMKHWIGYYVKWWLIITINDNWRGMLDMNIFQQVNDSLSFTCRLCPILSLRWRSRHEYFLLTFPSYQWCSNKETKTCCGSSSVWTCSPIRFRKPSEDQCKWWAKIQTLVRDTFEYISKQEGLITHLHQLVHL